MKTTVALSALLVALAWAPAPAGAEELARLSFTANELVFQPLVSAGGWELSVSGPGDFHLQKQFRGEAPVVSLATGFRPLADGIYTWELTLVPERAVGVDRGDSGRSGRARRSAGPPRILPDPQWGAFRVVNGAIVSPSLGEPELQMTAESGGGAQIGLPLPGAAGAGESGPVPLDITHNDDVIIDGSACIGLDCVNGESFGFDTLRLKENNLRIKFQDTSNSASFPTNDWQLTANDSSNGGANRFSIDDIDGGRTPFTIEASAPSHSLYVDDGGRIGLGTSTPVVEVHIKDGDTPTLRLEQDGSSGFTPQTWDVAGNETNFFIRDVTNGSRLPLRIRPSADSNSIFVDSDSDVGIGTSSPEARLHVVETGGGLPFLASEAGGSGASTVATFRADDRPRFFFEDTTNVRTWSAGVGGSGAASNFGFVLDSDIGANEFVLKAGDGDLTITGQIFTETGATCASGCDQVFQSHYPLETIEEHAAYMWANSHLPAVGPTPPDSSMNLSEKTAGLINELEKAHIYIEQLHQRLAEVETRLAAQEQAE